MRLSPLFSLLPLTFSLVACSVGGTLSGTLTDAVNGKPRTGVRVIAKAEGDADLTCQLQEADVDATGSFTLPKLCSGVQYKVTLSDEGLILADVPLVDGSAPTTTLALQAWRAPKGKGLFILTDDGLSDVRTFTEIKQEVSVNDPNLKVTYPYMKPTKLSYVVEPGSFLVVSGKTNIETHKYLPLIADPGKRTFQAGSIENHAWAGVRFTSETEWEPVTVTMDAAKVKQVEVGERIVQYIAHDAMPEGRYAIFGDDDTRMYIVDFGKSQDVAGVPVEEAPADGAPAEGAPAEGAAAEGAPATGG